MSGFSKSTIAFLKGLGADNSKAWFDAHRSEYDAHYIVPAKTFIEQVAGPLGAIAPNVQAEPRVNGSIFRINRDIRFSKDKTPYKDHLDLWFWEGDRKTALSSFFFRLTAGTLILGVGNHGLDKHRLEAFRAAVIDAGTGRQLADIANTLEADRFTIGGDHYARVPRGFVAQDAAAERFLKYNALWVSRETAHPKELYGDEFVNFCVERWRLMAPLHHWLMALA